jgi:predicted DNA-binding transcriptional regulator AlpA
MAKYGALPSNLPPRGLNRSAAASYIGVSPTKFDELVERGEMPPSKMIDKRRVWDRIALDAAFDAIPAAGESADNPWDLK